MTEILERLRTMNINLTHEAADEIERLKANDKLYAEGAKAYQAEISALQRTAKESCERADALEHEVVMLKARISNLEGQVAYRDWVAQI